MRNGWHGLGESLLLKDREISLSARNSNTESLRPSLWLGWSEKTGSEGEDQTGRLTLGGFVLVSDCTVNVLEVIHVWSVYPLRALVADTDVSHVRGRDKEVLYCQCAWWGNAMCVCVCENNVKRWNTHTCKHMLSPYAWKHMGTHQVPLFFHSYRQSCWLMALTHTHTHTLAS